MDTKLPCSVRFLGSALQLLLQQQEPRVVWFKDIFGSSQLTPGHFDFSYPSLPSAQTGKLSFSCCTSLVKIPIDCKGMFIGMDGPITEGLSQQELLREYGWDSVQCDWEIHHRSGLGEQSPAGWICATREQFPTAPFYPEGLGIRGRGFPAWESFPQGPEVSPTEGISSITALCRERI